MARDISLRKFRTWSWSYPRRANANSFDRTAATTSAAVWVPFVISVVATAALPFCRILCRDIGRYGEN